VFIFLEGLWKHPTKKVRFAEQVLELPKEQGNIDIAMAKLEKDNMPHNKEALYRGILKYRSFNKG
jgi:hypothetical protein